MSDLFFDTNEFDFNSLTDVIGLNEGNTATDSESVSRNAAAQRERTPEDLFNDDISDLMGDAFDEQEEEEQDFNQNVGDLNRLDQGDVIRITDYFNSAPDDAVLTVGNFEGTKAELADKIKKLDKVERDAAYFADQAERHDAESEAILKRGFMGKIAIEQNIAMLQSRLRQNLSDNEWRQTKPDLDMANAALVNLHNDVNQAWASRQQQETMTNYNRMYVADQKLDNEIPNWDKYQPLVRDYAKQLGIPDHTFEKIYDVGTAKALFKAMMYDRNKERVAETLRKSTAVNPHSVPSANKSTRNAKVSDVDHAKKARALKNMGGNRQANVEAFAYLKD